MELTSFPPSEKGHRESINLNCRIKSFLSSIIKLKLIVAREVHKFSILKALLSLC